MNLREFTQKLMRVLRLTHEAEDFDAIHESISKGVVFRGTNLWILIFAIIVASVGLNMNSTAVIIGAMLISPLMGPINGVGYSVATYNFDLFRKSLKNYGFATAAALVTSTVYFLITPIHTEHSELLSRTSPTIYDVLIAMFGGLAGIVAISSTNKGNVIPGVAIATALMPPLCTAGYGLAIANWSYFFGALYLYLINSVFIALSAMVVSQLLKFPRKTYLLSREIKNKNIAITIVTLLTVVPSVYLGFTLVQKEKFMHRAENFIKKVNTWDNNYLLSHKVDGDTKQILLVYGGNEFKQSSIDRLNEKADDLGLSDAKITVEEGLKFNDEEKINQKDTEIQKAKETINSLQTILTIKDKQIDSLESIPSNGQQLLREIHAIFPEIHACSYATSMVYNDSVDVPKKAHVILFDADDTFDKVNTEKLSNWLKNRLNSEDVIIKF